MTEKTGYTISRFVIIIITIWVICGMLFSYDAGRSGLLEQHVSSMEFGPLVVEEPDNLTIILVVEEPDNLTVMIEPCRNLSLTSTALCLNMAVETIYNYTETQDTDNVSLERLMTYGGDCRDYSILYERMGSELGFYTTTAPMITGKNSSHRIAIISDETGYCLLDQTVFRCLEFGGYGKKEEVV